MGEINLCSASPSHQFLPEAEEIPSHEEDDQQHHQQADDPTERVDVAAIAAVAEPAESQDDENNDDEEIIERPFSSASRGAVAVSVLRFRGKR